MSDKPARTPADIEREIIAVEDEFTRLRQNNPPGVAENFRDEHEAALGILRAELAEHAEQEKVKPVETDAAG